MTILAAQSVAKFELEPIWIGRNYFGNQLRDCSQAFGRILGLESFRKLFFQLSYLILKLRHLIDKKGVSKKQPAICSG